MVTKHENNDITITLKRKEWEVLLKCAEIAIAVSDPLPKKRYMEIWRSIAADKRVESFVTKFVRAIEKEHGIK